MAKTKQKTSLKKVPAVVQDTSLLRALTLLSVLLPLAYNPWGFNLYAPVRAALLYTGTIGLVFMVVHEGLKAGRFHFEYRREDVAVPGFIGALLLSTVFSVHMYSSVFGHFLRYEGLLAWFSYMALFIVARQAIKTREAVEFFLIWLARAALLISVYAVFQHFGLDFAQWRPGLVTNRAFSTLGNPAYLGAYLTLLLPIMTAMVFGASRRHRQLYIITCALMILALGFTLTRGAWLGFVVGLAVLAALNREQLRVAGVKTVLVVATAVLLVLASVGFLAGQSNIAANGYLGRIVDAVQGKGSVEGRWLTWKQVLPLVGERPLVGSGLDTLYLTFSGQITPEYERKIVRDTATDRAHNDLLQMAVSAGLIGLFAYLALLAVLIKVGLERTAKAPSGFWHWLMAGTVASLLGYLAMIQTHFSTIDVSPLFWVLAGLLAAAGDHGSAPHKLDVGPQALRRLLPRRAQITGAMIAAFTLIFIMSLLPAAADIFYRRAKEAEAGRAPELAVAHLRTAAAIDFRNDFYLSELGLAYLKYAPELRNSAFLDDAVTVLGRAHRFSPLNSYHLLHLGEGYLARYEHVGAKTDLNRALTYLRSAARQDPNYAALRLKLGLAYVYAHRYRRAESEWKRVIRLSPKAVSAYYNLGRLLQKEERFAESRRYFRAALRIDPNQAQAKDALEHHVPGELLWSTRLSAPVNDFDIPAAVAVDRRGFVYIAGFRREQIGSPDYTIAQYGPGGKLKWTRSYDGPASGADTPAALAVDKKCNLYITGASFNGRGDADYATVKYDKNGRQIWVARYDGPSGKEDTPAALAVDKDGNVYVTGASFSQDGAPDYATVKYGPGGREQWVKRYNGPGAGADKPIGVYLDGRGNVYVAGGSLNRDRNTDYAVVKYSKRGRQLWLSHYNGGGLSEDVPAAAAVDKKGNVYVTGAASSKDGAPDYATIKYGPMGRRKWVNKYEGYPGGVDTAVAVVPTGSGGAIVTGTSGGAKGEREYATVKYDGSGRQRWARRYGAKTPGDDSVDALALHKGGISVAGYTHKSGRSDLVALKYDSAGRRIWVRRHGGRDLPADSPAWMVADGAGNIIVTGADGKQNEVRYLMLKFAR